MSRIYCTTCDFSRGLDGISELIKLSYIDKAKDELSNHLSVLQKEITALFINYIENGGEIDVVLKKVNIEDHIVVHTEFSCIKCGGNIDYEIYPYYEAYRIARNLYKQQFTKNLERTGLLDLYNATKKEIENYADGALLTALLSDESEEVDRLKRSIDLHNSLPPESGGGEEELLIEIAMAIGFGIVGNLATDLLKFGFNRAFSKVNIFKRNQGIDAAIIKEIKEYNKCEPKHEFSRKEIKFIKRTIRAKMKSIIEDTVSNSNKKGTD